jgi:hypothetical protein
MGFVWFSVQAMITSLKNINKLIFVIEKCFLCGTDWILKYYVDEILLQGVKKTSHKRNVAVITTTHKQKI